MARFYVLENEVQADRVPGKRFLKLALGTRLVDPEGAKKAINNVKIKGDQIRFPDLLKVFASLHGTYSQSRERRKRAF